jgi:hypothetical protein
MNPDYEIRKRVYASGRVEYEVLEYVDRGPASMWDLIYQGPTEGAARDYVKIITEARKDREVVSSTIVERFSKE